MELLEFILDPKCVNIPILRSLGPKAHTTMLFLKICIDALAAGLQHYRLLVFPSPLRSRSLFMVIFNSVALLIRLVGSRLGFTAYFVPADVPSLASSCGS